MLTMAEGVGFEPTVPYGTTVFKTAAFDHSAIPPAIFRIVNKTAKSIYVKRLLAITGPGSGI
jgi:hypothetical protein